MIINKVADLKYTDENEIGFTCGGKCKLLFSQLGIYNAHRSGWMAAQHFGTFLSPCQ